jgi:hypothetical protein
LFETLISELLVLDGHHDAVRLFGPRRRVDEHALLDAVLRARRRELVRRTRMKLALSLDLVNRFLAANLYAKSIFGEDALVRFSFDLVFTLFYPLLLSLDPHWTP